MKKTITLWVARDRDGSLFIYENKPVYNKQTGWFTDYARGWAREFVDTNFDFRNMPPLIPIVDDAIQKVCFENSPVEVELTIKIKE